MFGKENCGNRFSHNHHNHWEMFFDKSRSWKDKRWNWDNSDQKLDSSSLSLLILFLINEKPSYGYELIKSIEEKFDNTYSPEPEEIYPNLSKLEDMGFLKSETDNGKKIYSITEEGKAYLETNKDKTDKIFETIEYIKQTINADDIKKVYRYARNIAMLVYSGYKENNWGRKQIKALIEILERTTKEIKEI